MGVGSVLYEPIPWESAVEWRRIVGSPFCPLRNGTKWVLTVLSRYGDSDGLNIYPSQRELAYRAGVSVKTANHALQHAEEEGWIVRRLVDRPNGRGYKSHVYELTIPDYVADYAIGRHRFWEPKYTERYIKEGEVVRLEKRYRT
jgi:hypothetical protein